jgi:GNAT superfamily N-acetyltransferase
VSVSFTANSGPVDIAIREITAADATAAARLSGELGYPVSPEEMRRRIESLVGMPDHAVYVACISGEVVGWIHVSVSHHLQAEPRAEIGGLVVSSEARSRGIGRRLVAVAEEWALQHSLGGIVVRSRSTREAAHRFYLREGYTQTKTSAVFTKSIGAAGNGEINNRP